MSETFCDDWGIYEIDEIPGKPGFVSPLGFIQGHQKSKREKRDIRKGTLATYLTKEVEKTWSERIIDNLESYTTLFWQADSKYLGYLNYKSNYLNVIVHCNINCGQLIIKAESHKAESHKAESHKAESHNVICLMETIELANPDLIPRFVEIMQFLYKMSNDINDFMVYKFAMIKEFQK